MSNNAVLLYRHAQTPKEEIEAIQKYFPGRNAICRAAVPPESLVIGRYACLPWYSELYKDLQFNHSVLINHPTEHQYVADLQNYYQDLEGLTPKTWFQLSDVPHDAGPFFLKGATNSMKQRWTTSAYAEDFPAAVKVESVLSDDALIGPQGIYVRKFVPLKTFGIAIGGCPVTMEFRFFVLDQKILCGAYYWSGHEELFPEEKVPTIDVVPESFLQQVIKRVGSNIRFYALDVAQTAEDLWVVIELNDAQQSGLSCNDPDTFYKALSEAHI